MIVKHREKVDFLPHVVATTPQDKSSCCRMLPRFWTFLLLATVVEVIVAICLKCLRRTSPLLPHSPSFSFSLAVSSLFLALYPVYRLFSARPYSQWNFSLVNKLSLHATQSQLSVLSRYFYVTLNLVVVKKV